MKNYQAEVINRSWPKAEVLNDTLRLVNSSYHMKTEFQICKKKLSVVRESSERKNRFALSLKKVICHVMTSLVSHNDFINGC